MAIVYVCTLREKDDNSCAAATKIISSIPCTGERKIHFFIPIHLSQTATSSHKLRHRGGRVVPIELHLKRLSQRREKEIEPLERRPERDRKFKH